MNNFIEIHIYGHVRNTRVNSHNHNTTEAASTAHLRKSELRGAIKIESTKNYIQSLFAYNRSRKVNFLVIWFSRSQAGDDVTFDKHNFVEIYFHCYQSLL